MLDRTSPIKLIGTVHTPIWSGDRLCKIYDLLDGDRKIGELWNTSEDATAIIVDETMPFSEYLSRIGHAAPPLVKLLDAAAPLSIQVHPDDESAELLGGTAKTELWYILDADEGAYILYGTLPEIDRSTVKEAILDGDVEPLLCRIPVHKGDVYMIPPGMIHSLGAGVTVLEVQDRAGTTYRVRDIAGNRETHKAESAESVRIYSHAEADALTISDRLRLDGTPLPGEMISATSGFTLSLLQTAGDHLKIKTKHRGLYLFCESGGGSARGLEFKAGESLYLPEADVEIELKKDSTVFFVR